MDPRAVRDGSQSAMGHWGLWRPSELQLGARARSHPKLSTLAFAVAALAIAALPPLPADPRRIVLGLYE
jgi:hypothetical protein